MLTSCRPFKKLFKLAKERDQPLLRSLVFSTTMKWAVGMADREPERGRARKTSPEGANEERQALVSGGSDYEDIETEMLEESNASARGAMRALGRSETLFERWRQRRLMNNYYSRRDRCFGCGQVGLMLEITSRPTKKQTAGEFGRSNTGWNFSLQVKSR